MSRTDRRMKINSKLERTRRDAIQTGTSLNMQEFRLLGESKVVSLSDSRKKSAFISFVPLVRDLAMVPHPLETFHSGSYPYFNYGYTVFSCSSNFVSGKLVT